jgi:choline-sulfatase
VYTTDHEDMTGEHGLWWKRTFYDASASVPLIITGPGLPEDIAIDQPVELVDLFPTFCAMAGCDPPDDVDGESLLPLWTGEGVRRKTTARSELLSPKPETAFRMIRDERWKYVEFPVGPPVLFDLANDPSEDHNLMAGKAPEDAPLESLKKALSDGLDWDDLERLRNRDFERWKADKRSGAWSPAQYRLRDGRIVNADAFLYPDLSEPASSE